MKRFQFIFLAFLPFLFLSLSGCGPSQPKVGSELVNPVEKAFLNNLASLCGQSFEGEEAYMRAGRESWAHMYFVMHVTVCEDEKVYVPFHLDEDHSRTWMFLVEDGKLRFRHDHRDPDGTPHQATMYGGYANGEGTAFKQYFPADDYTIDNRISSANSLWIVELAEDLSTFSYTLFAGETKIFRADFDLTNPL